MGTIPTFGPSRNEIGLNAIGILLFDHGDVQMHLQKAADDRRRSRSGFDADAFGGTIGKSFGSSRVDESGPSGVTAFAVGRTY